jgi:hypothetical protein
MFYFPSFVSFLLFPLPIKNFEKKNFGGAAAAAASIDDCIESSAAQLKATQTSPIFPLYYLSFSYLLPTNS